MKYLIVGLGNIGEEYKSTRHNIGFMVVDYLSEEFGLHFSIDRFASMALLKYKGRQIYLLKPTTFMNKSGQAVNYWKQKLSISTENILVIVDDLALPVGTLRLKSKGSAAGHNGLIDIENVLSTNVYSRLRLGIGNNFFKGKQADYVLSKFKSDEIELMQSAIVSSSEAIKIFCTDGINVAMNMYN